MSKRSNFPWRPIGGEQGQGGLHHTAGIEMEANEGCTSGSDPFGIEMGANEDWRGMDHKDA